MSNYENHLDKEEARWFAVYTNFKREKIVKRMLDSKEIECYLPLQKVTRRYTRKIKTLELPLISCYLFVKITKSEYIRVLETEHVIKFIRFSKNLLSIPEREMEIMKRVVGEGMEIEVEPNSLKEGDEVEVITGNLVGLKGRLIEIQGKNQMVVDLDNIGYSLRMNIDANILQKVSVVN